MIKISNKRLFFLNLKEIPNFEILKKFDSVRQVLIYEKSSTVLGLEKILFCLAKKRHPRNVYNTIKCIEIKKTEWLFRCQIEKVFIINKRYKLNIV